MFFAQHERTIGSSVQLNTVVRAGSSTQLRPRGYWSRTTAGGVRSDAFVGVRFEPVHFLRNPTKACRRFYLPVPIQNENLLQTMIPLVRDFPVDRLFRGVAPIRAVHVRRVGLWRLAGVAPGEAGEHARDTTHLRGAVTFASDPILQESAIEFVKEGRNAYTIACI